MTRATAARFLAVLVTSAVISSLVIVDAHAQLGKIGAKVKQRTDQATNQAVDKGLDQVDPTKQKPASATDTRRVRHRWRRAGSRTRDLGDSRSFTSHADRRRHTGCRAKEWANYDFVPGNRVIFDIDFTEDKVGNFPERLEYTSGQMELVELDGVRMLKASDRAELLVPLGEALPARYTIEVDFISKNGTWGAISLAGGKDKATEGSTRVDVGDQAIEVTNGYTKVVNSYYSEAQRKALQGTLVHARFQGDNKYLKVYANERRIANIPSTTVVRANVIYLSLWGADGGDRPVYVSRIRVAETQATVYDALAASGRWTTQGILFPTGSSELMPESTPTLKEIAATLKAHPELKVEIQGHTDNVGKPGENMTLSDARAASVKTALRGPVRRQRGPAHHEGLWRHQASGRQQDDRGPAEQPARRPGEVLRPTAPQVAAAAG